MLIELSDLKLKYISDIFHHRCHIWFYFHFFILKDCVKYGFNVTDQIQHYLLGSYKLSCILHKHKLGPLGVKTLI